jgi:DNA-binding beta-propeller fold protein YncE
LFSFGSTGTGNGEFKTPADVAIDGSDNIYVVDADNNRVQKFDSAGMFLSQFGTSGTGAGQFNRPQGIFVDRATDRIYVADTGNQRVQRFNQNGTIDTGWGSGGIVGTTGVVRRDHAGFDGPTNVAVHPIDGNVYVADHGNQRLEVYDSDGSYVRTFLAVYRPNSLAFDSAGNLYIAGDDPNDSYTAFDGRIRLLRAGDELISQHYTGGIDDIGRIERGVALRNDGSIVFSDTINGRLVKTDPAFTRPIGDLAIVARGTSVTFRWKTAQAGTSSVHYGTTTTLGSEVNDPTVTTDHKVIVNNLTPNTRLFYNVSFPDSFDGTQRGTPVDILNTGASAGATQFLRLKAVGLIYLDTNPGSGFVPMNNEQLTAARNRFSTISRFYWINSGFKLWLDYTIVEIDRDLVGDCFTVGGAAEADLSARGFSATDDFDAVHATSLRFCGNFGGQGTLFGRFIGQSEWVSQDDFSAIHEVNHSIDSIYNLNGLTKYEFNHGIWAIPNALGRDFAVNAQIVRNMMPVNFTATKAPFNKIMTAPDNDNDGVPDSSPSGLTNALSITEDKLKSSNTSTDSDGDGLNDLLEATALPFHSTDLNAQDTDGDGIRDGADLNPAYRVAQCIIKGTPAIDGTINSGEGWTILTDHWGYVNDALVPDSNALQENVTTYAAWDENFLYLALKGPPAATTIHLDGNSDNWFMNPDNYQLIVRNDFTSIAVKINVGVPDLFRQIDNDGQFSEFFDTDPQFTKPYQGRSILTDPGDGLGFPGRLVSEADLLYGHGGSGNNSVWEVAIPRSNKTLLKTFTGKKMAIDIDVGGDKLFESDHAARFTLIENDNTPPTITCPEDIIVNSDPGVPHATVNIVIPTVSDNCSVSINGVRSDGKALTDPYPIGTTTINWTATDVGGNTSSCSSTVTVNLSASAQSILENVLAKIAELDGETTDQSDHLTLRQASDAITHALTFFTDPNRLSVASGAEAFDDLRYAVKKLTDLLEDADSEVPAEEVRGCLSQIRDAARLLAVTSIEDAVDRGGKQRSIDKANLEVSVGDQDASAGRYYDAVTHYRNAWGYAVHA